MAHYLEPLAIATNIIQASFCRLDQVLVTFGFLIMRYSDPAMDQDPMACDAIVNSLEKHWQKCDQEVFIAMVLVNPLFRMLPFAALPFLNKAHI